MEKIKKKNPDPNECHICVERARCGLSCRAVCVGCTHVKFAKSSPQVPDSWPCCCRLCLERQVPGASPVVRRSHATSKSYMVEIFHCVLEKWMPSCHQRGACRRFCKDPVEVAVVYSTPRPVRALRNQCWLAECVLYGCFIRRRNPSVWNWSVPGWALTVNTDWKL